ncbi:MAG: hypothetical protein K2P94_01975 [Rhodospirillaceae bacterium]|nr:hypothetical protein [Rhodospirillaceae bacterium]
MQRHTYLLGVFALVLPLSLLSAQPARASETKLTSAVELRSGPGHDYPFVKRLAKGLSMEVHGCLNSWDWCDVTWRGARGWVPANTLEFQREDQRLPVGRYGAALGVPEVTFSLGKYWDAYYNDTPWYADRDMWTQRSAVQRTDAGF